MPGTSIATIYTVPSSTDVKLTQVVLCNTTGTAAAVTLSAVPSGQTAGAANRLLAGLVVDANGVVTVDLDTYLGPADFLAMSQGTSSAVTATISGETYS